MYLFCMLTLILFPNVRRVFFFKGILSVVASACTQLLYQAKLNLYQNSALSSVSVVYFECVRVCQCVRCKTNASHQISSTRQTPGRHLGLSETAFKDRYRNHVRDFKNEIHYNKTELSKYVWDLKRNNKEPQITWTIACKVYGTPKRNFCRLCLNI